MEYFIGMLIPIVGVGIFYMGYITGEKRKPPKQEIDEETQRRQKQFFEDFEAIMNYDVAQAMQRKKVE